MNKELRITNREHEHSLALALLL